MLWSLGMAVGVIFIFITPGYSANLMSFLFGNILTVSTANLYMLFVLTIVIVIVFLTMFRSILYVAFDEQFARTVGLPVTFVNYLMITLVAVTIVLSIRIAGIILVLSLLTIPQTIANIFTKDFKSIIFLSIVTALTGSFAGLFLSYYFNIPSGATIIFFLIVLFILARSFKTIQTTLRLKSQINRKA